MSSKFKALTSALVICSALSMGTPVLAEDNNSTNINIEREATLVHFVASNDITTTFKADGTTVTPTNYSITNLTPNVAIKVTNVEIKGQTVGDETWGLLADTVDNSKLIKNTVNNTNIILKMDLGKKGTFVDASSKFNTDNVIEENGTIGADFQVTTRSAFSDAKTTNAAYVITPTVTFNTAP